MSANDGAIMQGNGRIAGLRAAIQAAFPAASYTGKVTRHDGAWLPELSEENAIHDDDKLLYDALNGRKWTEVPKEFLRAVPDGFVLLTEQALAAFLGAWLMCSLDNIDGENIVREFVVYSFSPEPNRLENNKDFEVSLLRALSPEQRSVVRSLLVEFAERETSNFIRIRAAKGVALIDSLPPSPH